MTITFTSFTQPSPLYEQSLILRNRVLIREVGRYENCRDFDCPEKDIYISAYDGEILIGTAIITPLDTTTVQMRQMAVHEMYRGRGVGQAIVREFERRVREKGYSAILLHARETALPFYEKLGYERQSDKFYEIDIAHFEMRKSISQRQ